MTNMNNNRGTLGGDTYRTGSNGRAGTGVSNTYNRSNTGSRSGNEHKNNGKGWILLVALLCVTILIAAHMIADGMKSANQNQVAATTIETTTQEPVPAETSDEDEGEPEADEEEEETEKEPVIKDKVRLSSLDPVNVVNMHYDGNDFPTVSDITDAWGNQFASAYIMADSVGYEFTYDTDGAYDAFVATLCNDDTTSSTGNLKIYDADGDEMVLLGEYRLERNSRPKSIKIELQGCKYVTFKYISSSWDGTLGLADAAFVTYE